MARPIDFTPPFGSIDAVGAPTDPVDEPSDAAGWLQRVVDLHDVRARSHAEVLAAVSAMRRLTTGQRATLRDDSASRPARGTAHLHLVDELSTALRISGMISTPFRP